MYRSEISTSKKCVKLVINTNCTEMHGQQNIKNEECIFVVERQRERERERDIYVYVTCFVFFMLYPYHVRHCISLHLMFK